MRTRISSVNIDGRVRVVSTSNTLFGTSRGVLCASSTNTARHMTKKRADDLRKKAMAIREYREKEARRKAHSISFDERKWAENFKFA